MARNVQRGFLHFAENCKIPRLDDQIISLADDLDQDQDVEIKQIVKSVSLKPAGTASKKSLEKVVPQFSLTESELHDIDNLIDFEIFGCAEDAMLWLMREGFKANREYLDRVEDVRKQVNSLKSSI